MNGDASGGVAPVFGAGLVSSAGRTEGSRGVYVRNPGPRCRSIGNLSLSRWRLARWEMRRSLTSWNDGSVVYEPFKLQPFYLVLHELNERREFQPVSTACGYLGNREAWRVTRPGPAVIRVAVRRLGTLFNGLHW